MNLLKILRKPYLSIFLALFVSCSQYDDNGITNNQDVSEAKVVTTLIELNNTLINQKGSKLSEKKLNAIYQDWLKQNNYDYVYELHKLVENSKASEFSDDVVSFMKSSNDYNEFQVDLIEMIDNDFKFNNTVKNALENIQEMRLSNSYTEDEKVILTSLSMCVQFFDATLSSSDSYSAKFLSAKWQCYLSIASMAITTTLLATLTGGASLLVMGAVLGAYTIESILLVASCRCHFQDECD